MQNFVPLLTKHQAQSTRKFVLKRHRILLRCIYTVCGLLIAFPFLFVSNDQRVTRLQKVSSGQEQLRAVSESPGSTRPYTCSRRRRHRMAEESSKTKVTHEYRYDFVRNSKHEQIARGSGKLEATGVFLETLSQVQHTTLGLFGTVGEIGVHHGRFTSFLYMTARETETLMAVDLFEPLQDANVDMSGMGSLRAFAKGLHLYGLNTSDVKISVASSLDLDVEGFSWIDESPGLRLWSVDGGHTAETTRNDLRLAFCNLLQGGIVVLDDWFNPPWPGVVEGFFEFVHHDRGIGRHKSLEQKQQHDVYPFLLCENKMYLTNDRNAHALYLETILHDPVLRQWITMYAKTGVQRGRSFPFLMVDGTRYVRCNSSAFPSHDDIRAVWLERLKASETKQTLARNSSRVGT